MFSRLRYISVLVLFSNVFAIDYSPQVSLDLQYGKVRNYGRASLFRPLVKEGDKLPFINIFGLSDTQGATEGNLGLGYRQLFNYSIYGGYIFYDQRKSGSGNMYRQITFGVEHLRESFEVRLNGYVPIGRTFNKSSYGNGVHMENALQGFDVEFGGNISSNFESYASFYYFGDKDVSMPGYRLRANYNINSHIKLLGELSYDSVREFNYFAGIRLGASLQHYNKDNGFPAGW